MYGREYQGEIFTFEPSGGLINASLVMQDFETDSYWSIMANQAVSGIKKGQKLTELPVGEKLQWQDWVKKYPETLVLSVNGLEDAAFGYASYFNSSRGFRGLNASDERLSDKEPIFAFNFNNQNYAVANEIIEGGKGFDLGGKKIFLYRPEGAALFYSTIAYKTEGSGFEFVNNHWIDVDSKCEFDPDTHTFVSGDGSRCPQKLNGFDTFWYTWSLTNPDTKLLE